MVFGGGEFNKGVYSPHSAVCRAAIHAGVLTNFGGEVEIESVEGREKYLAGGPSNGVLSFEDGEYIRSFKFVPSTKGVCREYIQNQLGGSPLDDFQVHDSSKTSFEVMSSPENAARQIIGMRERKCGADQRSGLLVLKDFYCDSYELKVRLRFNGPGRAGVVAAVKDAQNYVIVEAVVLGEGLARGIWRIRQFTNGKGKEIKAVGYAFDFGAYYNVHLSVHRKSGSEDALIKAEIGGEGRPTEVSLEFTSDKPRSSLGGAGLAACDAPKDGVLFDGFIVESTSSKSLLSRI